MVDSEWDVVVIGGGPAGLAAALMLGRSRRRVLVVDAGSPRNRFAAHMHGVLGNEGCAPADLLARGRAEVAGYGVRVVEDRVTRVDLTEHGVRVDLADGGPHGARAALVATGLRDELPEVPGLAQRWGTSVLHCPYCHGWEVRGQRLGLLLTSPLGLHAAELVRQLSDQVTVFAAGVEVDETTRHRLRSRGSPGTARQSRRSAPPTAAATRSTRCSPRPSRGPRRTSWHTSSWPARRLRWAATWPSTRWAGPATSGSGPPAT
jgi:thioredoxin reductase